MTETTIHRVQPHMTDAWLAGTARPPGDGFTPVPPRGWWWRVLAWCSARTTDA